MNVLLIIAQKDFQPIEYKDTRDEIENAGFKVDVASITTEDAIGGGMVVKPDIALKNVDVDDYNSIVVIGGPGAPKLEENGVFELIKNANSKGKVVAAICYSPVILAKAGILEKKKATVFPNADLVNKLKEYKVEYVNKDVVRDGKIVTGNGPGAARDFGKKIVEVLNES